MRFVKMERMGFVIVVVVCGSSDDIQCGARLTHYEGRERETKSDFGAGNGVVTML
jgi:hypothetical protein